MVATVLSEVVKAGQQALGEDAFAGILASGRRLSHEQAATEALAVGQPFTDAPELAPAPARDAGGMRQVSAAPGGLSSREVEVLRLITAGCTSQEVADRLVISIHTVDRHITHIYQKLGVRGRAEAVAFAFTHGIAE
jgi:DNA-binding NarL/FixJ family response regulator